MKTRHYVFSAPWLYRYYDGKGHKGFVPACDTSKLMHEGMVCKPEKVTCLRCRRTKAFKEKANAK